MIVHKNSNAYVHENSFLYVYKTVVNIFVKIVA